MRALYRPSFLFDMKGIYVCIFEIKNERIRVGSLGDIKFSAGTYLYVGSGGNNVAKRVQRHVNGAKSKRWHIDYISSKYPAKECYILESVDREVEEELASMLSLIYTYIPGFGSSDSAAISHFFRVDENILNVLSNFGKLKGKEWKKL